MEEKLPQEKSEHCGQRGNGLSVTESDVCPLWWGWDVQQKKQSTERPPSIDGTSVTQAPLQEKRLTATSRKAPLMTVHPPM